MSNGEPDFMQLYTSMPYHIKNKVSPEQFAALAQEIHATVKANKASIAFPMDICSYLPIVQQVATYIFNNLGQFTTSWWAKLILAIAGPTFMTILSAVQTEFCSQTPTQSQR